MIGSQPASLSLARDRVPEQPAPRGQEQRDYHQHGQAEHDGRPRGQVLRRAAQQCAGHARAGAKERRERDHRPHPVRPLACGRRRGHHHRAHQHHAHRLQADHDGHHEHGGEQHVERAHRQPQSRAEVAVEGEEFELLPEEEAVPNASAPSAAISTTSRSIRVAACPKRNRSSPAWLASGSFWMKVQQHQPQTEEDREHDPQRAVLLDARVAHHAHHQQRRQPPATAAPSISTSGALLPVSRNASAIPGSAAWRDGIAQQALPAQHRVGAEPAADRAQRRRAQRTVRSV